MVVTMNGGRSISGVAVTILGVCEGIGVHTGKGCGGEPHVSHAARMNESNSQEISFFIKALYSGEVVIQKRVRHLFNIHPPFFV